MNKFHPLRFAVLAAPLLALLPGYLQPAFAQDKVTYDDHIRPILREHCFSCHNQDQGKGGLVLDSYGRTMEGGAGGEVVIAEDPSSSRLWTLINHDEQPYMPPGQDKLPAEKLALVKKWIETARWKAPVRKSLPRRAWSRR